MKGFIIALAIGALISNAMLARAHGDKPTPMPSARACAYFKELYLPTTEEFNKLTQKQRSYILAQVKTISPADRRYARWMKDDTLDEGVVVFDAFPVYPDDKIGSHAAWVATDTNVGLDPIECRMFITPTADTGTPIESD